MTKKTLRRRIRAGIERAKAENKHCGRARDEQARALVMKLKAEGMRPAQIAETANVSRSTVYRIFAEAA